MLSLVAEMRLLLALPAASLKPTTRSANHTDNDNNNDNDNNSKTIRLDSFSKPK